jgi:hypothetical protein
MVAGSYGKRDGLFDYVDGPARGVDLVTADHILANRVMAVRKPVIKSGGLEGRPQIHGAAHPSLSESSNLLRVTGQTAFARRGEQATTEDDRPP